MKQKVGNSVCLLFQNLKMVTKIKDYYENGEFKKRVVRTIPDKIVLKEEIGAILEKPHLNDIVFEDNVKEAILLMLDRARKETINLLFTGSAGTGKTTTAEMFSVETGKPFIYMTGSLGDKKIKEMLLNAKKNSIILIDEIHNLPEKVAEIIYPAIQSNEIYADGKAIRLNELMFIGTTTEPEKLPKPLLARFKVVEFEELSNGKLKEVLIKKGCNERIAELLLNFTTNFRILNQLLDTMKLYGEINENNLTKVFRLKRINVYSGLSDLQEKYLDIVKKSEKPVSLRTLGLFLRKSENFIKYELETDLIRKNMIFISSRGREINPEFKDYGYAQLKEAKSKAEEKKTEEEIDFRNTARVWLENNKHIKDKFKGRYNELVDFIAQNLSEGVEPDLIDLVSFGNDCSIEESFDNNYLGEL